MSNTLFPGSEPSPPRREEPPPGRPRVQRPERHQVTFEAMDLDSLLPAEHRARTVWAYVEGLEFDELYQRIRAVEGHSGRPAIDPAILLALWLYATLEGVGSARALDRLCREHHAYRWLCGRVSVNYHTLSDFRVDHAETLDRLLTQSVAALVSEGLVSLDRVAQDGMRVRASAGAPSFRRPGTLRECLQEAEEHVRQLRRELEEDPAATSRRQAAARARAVREREERIRRALRVTKQIERRRRDRKQGRSKQEPRASTTDPDAQVMKMGDGGYRPAFNAELATDTKSQVIVGLDVINVGSDAGQMSPMAEQVRRRFRRRPRQWLADGGFATLGDIDAMERHCEVFSPSMKARPRHEERCHSPRAVDPPRVAVWRRRMRTRRAAKVYRWRGAAAECVNAIARNRGLQRFLVRGLEKTRAVLLWFALAHNLMRSVALRGTA